MSSGSLEAMARATSRQFLLIDGDDTLWENKRLLRASDRGVHRLLVLTLAGERISAITRFDPGILERVGLPRTLRD
jgi:hypothetical protein